MDALVQYLDKAGVDASALDETIADYIIQLGREGGTEEETWSVLEGCFPELQESPESRKAFSELLAQLRQPCVPSASESLDLPDQTSCTHRQKTVPQDQNVTAGGSRGRNDARTSVGGSCRTPGGPRSSLSAGTGGDEPDLDFLREMMPHVSDRGLRYVLYRLTKGSRVAAASYLADRCAGAGSALKRLEAEAEACEQRELEDSLKAEDASRRAEEARRIDKEEREALKGKIVGRYADEAEGSVTKVVVPSLTETKQRTRYRDGKVVTTTGAKVIVESLKPEWDGGSRGKVKTKGKRGKGFV